MAHGTFVTGEVAAAAWPMTVPLAGAAIICDVAANPIAALARAAKTIMRIASTSLVRNKPRGLAKLTAKPLQLF